MTIINSEVDICNVALGLLRIKEIADIKSPVTEEAKICARYYNIVKEALLRTSIWNFAIKRTVLASDSETPAFEWQYQSTDFPNDYIRIIGLYYSNGEMIINTNNKNYAVEGNKILTNIGAPYYFKYVADITNVNKFDKLFKMNLVYLLALTIAKPLGSSSTTKETIRTDWETIWKPDAISIDGQENPPVRISDNEYINVRGSLSSLDRWEVDIDA